MTTETLIYPATCPRCGSMVEETLWSDPRVPIYACGSLPYQLSCPVVTDAPDELLVNVTIPTGQDLAAYAAIVGLATIAWANDPPSFGDRIGLCEVMHCDATAVDGRCMEHA